MASTAFGVSGGTTDTCSLLMGRGWARAGVHALDQAGAGPAVSRVGIVCVVVALLHQGPAGVDAQGGGKGAVGCRRRVAAGTGKQAAASTRV